MGESAHRQWDGRDRCVGGDGVGSDAGGGGGSYLLPSIPLLRALGHWLQLTL
jgi:hypothetical protein